MEVKNARDTLTAAAKSWRRRSAALAAERDPLVRAMLDSNQFTKEEIHMLTGLGRMTIDRIGSN
jgi:hypothetical protein